MLQATKPIRHPRTSRTSNRKAELLDPATIETRFYGLVLRGASAVSPRLALLRALREAR
jgi:hypothetical protein